MNFPIADEVASLRARAVAEFGERAGQANAPWSGYDAAAERLGTLRFHGSGKKNQLFFSGAGSGCFTSP